MTNTVRKRRANRLPIPLQAYCSFERVEGIASLVDISYTGALFEDTEMRPKIGTRVTFYVHLKPPRAFEAAIPSELTGLVSRHSSDGFAVEFESSHDPYMRRVVDDAAAIVAARR